MSRRSEVEVEIRDSDQISAYVESLRELEESILYPIDDGADHFSIDHGEQYHPFFSHMGDAYFMLARRGEQVIGSLAGVFRYASVGDERVSSIYFCDFKLRENERGGVLARKMAGLVLKAAIMEPRFWRWRIAYFAAMTGERGDVTRSMRRMHTGRLLDRAAKLWIYFVPASSLADLELSAAPSPPGGLGADFSPDVRRECQGAGWMSTAGRKDLRLRSSGEPWPLVHLPLGPRQWGESWGRYLKDVGEELSSGVDDPTTCFAIDARLEDHVTWLASQGVEAQTSCVVYALSIPNPRSIYRYDWVHLATSEI